MALLRVKRFSHRIHHFFSDLVVSACHRGILHSLTIYFRPGEKVKFFFEAKEDCAETCSKNHAIIGYSIPFYHAGQFAMWSSWVICD
jgi:hypothetical protein